MNHKILIVVDMQNDFVEGALGTKEARAIVPRVVKFIKDWSGDLIFTLDTHGDNYLETQEGKKLPVPHCLRGQKGWELIAPLEALQKERRAPLYMKETFGSFQLAQDLQRLNAASPLSEIRLIGLCTDICVVSNALLIKAALPQVPVCVTASCCAGVTPASHEAALETMRQCQVEID